MENILFAGKEHEAFYYNMLKAVGNTDVYHRAFFYTMGISKETRENIHSLFNFEENCIETQNLAAAWQTGGTIRLCRLAFTFGTGGQRGEKRSTSRRMNCLTAVLLLTFLKLSGCAIPSIAGIRSVLPCSSLQRNCKPFR